LSFRHYFIVTNGHFPMFMNVEYNLGRNAWVFSISFEQLEEKHEELF